MGIYRYQISLRFRHPNIDPAEITSQLGIVPNISWRSGEPRITPKRTPLEGVRRETYWSAGMAEGISTTNHLSTVLHQILDRLEVHGNFFEQIRLSGGSADFFVGWYLKSQGGDVFDQVLLTRLTAFGIDLALDNYHDASLSDEE